MLEIRVEELAKSLLRVEESQVGRSNVAWTVIVVLAAVIGLLAGVTALVKVFQ